MQQNEKIQANPSVRYLEVDICHEGQRLDNFLIKKIKGVPKSRLYRLLRKGEIRINKGRQRPDYRLRCGDVVRIPPLRQGLSTAKQLASGDLQWLAARILYEDKHILAVDKPAGLAVHGGSGVSLGLIEAFRKLRPHAGYLELVHRLDRDTSGCLLLAKKRSALIGLHEQLQTGRTDKRYAALLKGRWQGRTRMVREPLLRVPSSTGERIVRLADNGKEACSRISPRQLYGEIASLVEIKLLTGRTHQARVHTSSIGHAIAGDKKYGDEGFNQQMYRFGLRRMFLHASDLGFVHPGTGDKMWLQAPLPSELAELLEYLAHETKV